MKGRHQFRRRFSLQPSLPREPEESGRSARKSNGSDDAASGGGSPSSDVRYKIVVMGAAKVGKSSLISQFLYGTFSPRYKRTVEEMHRADFAVQGVRLSLDILDTSGSFEFPAMRALSISSADAFVLVYDVNDAATFEEAGAIRDQIHEAKASSQVPIVVVGNKVDLADASRQMDYDTTESVVTVDWENGFVEASAKDNLNVCLVFKELLAQAKVKYDLSPALRRKRRQSLPPAAALAPAAPPAAAVPSPQQLAHLRQIRDRHSGAKRNSCVLS